MSDTILDRMRVAFRSEALELLAELDSALLSLEAEPENGEFVHRVFRAIHTVKGSGATAGFTHLAEVAHKVEEAFDLAREGQLEITGGLIDCGLKACDLLRAILGSANPDQVSPGEEDLARRLAELLPRPKEKPEETGTTGTGGNESGAAVAYEVVVRPHKDLFYSGTDPIPLLDELRELGQAHIEAHSEGVPLFLDLEPESCYLWWELKLVTDRGENAIRDVFTFVEDECDVSIRLLDDQPSALALLGSIPAETLQIFAAECQDHLEAIEGLALALEADRLSRESLDALFRAVHSIKGNVGLLLGQLPAESLGKEHPLPALSRLAHAVESYLDPHRQVGGAPVGSEKVALLLEARDSMQCLLEKVAGHGSGYVTPQHLLEQLGLVAEIAVSADASASAFHNTAAQCLDIGQNCLGQIANGKCAPSVLKAYERSLKTLRSAAAYQKRADLEEAVAWQLRILEAAIRSGGQLTPEQRSQLQEGFQSARSRVEGVTETAEKALADSAAHPAPSVSTTIRMTRKSSTGSCVW